jgi:DNA-directed RNA polymerase specialized sigma24 family protein
VDLVPLDRLERDWQRELANGTVARHLREWRIKETALSSFSSPDALTRYLRASSGGDRQDAVLGALVRQARTDVVAARLVLQRLLPALKRRAGRLLIDASDREELWSLLLAQTWEKIRTFPIGRLPHHVAANLVLSSVRDAVRTLAAEHAPVDRSLVDEPGQPPDGEPEPTTRGIDGVLARAVTAGAISTVEAELIAITRIDGQPLGPIAVREGVTLNTLVQRRRRAEQRLLLQMPNGSVTWRGSFWPLCGARVSGAGSLGLAGGEDQPTPPRR